jgi:hypothetical protein
MAAYSFWDYIKAAFNAKPRGMFIAPNWVGLAAFGLLGFLNPGFWIVGAGLELGYLLGCANSARFRNVINAGAEREVVQEQQASVAQILAAVSPPDRERYHSLTQRCQKIMQDLRATSSHGAAPEQIQGLAHLAWIYLNLLKTRRVLKNHLGNLETEEASAGTLEARLQELDQQMSDTSLSEELQRSLDGRRTILQERLAKRTETESKFSFTEAELQRIEDQVTLMQDQAALQADPGQISGSLDRISSDLKEASTWIREQHRIYRDLGDTLDEPAPTAIFAQE